MFTFLKPAYWQLPQIPSQASFSLPFCILCYTSRRSGSYLMRVRFAVRILLYFTVCWPTTVKIIRVVPPFVDILGIIQRLHIDFTNYTKIIHRFTRLQNDCKFIKDSLITWRILLDYIAAAPRIPWRCYPSHDCPPHCSIKYWRNNQIRIFQ